MNPAATRIQRNTKIPSLNSDETFFLYLVIFETQLWYAADKKYAYRVPTADKNRDTSYN